MPNLFEFQHLLGHKVTGLHQCIDAARESFKPPALITSVPVDTSSQCGNLLVLPDKAWLCTSPHLDKVPHGTGDLLTGLFVGNFLAIGDYEVALSNASGQLNSVLKAAVAAGSDELVLSQLMKIPFPSDFPRAQPV